MAERETLAQWADRIAAAHEGFYRRTPKGEVIPTFLLQKQDGSEEIYAAPWRDRDEKWFVYEMIRALLINPAYVRYAAWSESWVVCTDTKSDPAKHEATMQAARRGELHEHPDRSEVVVTMCVDRYLPEPFMVRQKIIRGRSGGVRLLQREPNDGYRYGFGDMAELFPKATVQ